MSNVVEFDSVKTRRYLEAVFTGFLKDPAHSDYQRGFLAAALVIYSEGLGQGPDDRLKLLHAQVNGAS